MKTIMIKNGKGGEGKTLISINLAALLSKKGKVLHIDTDPRCSATNFWLKSNVPVTGTLGEWLISQKESNEIIHKSSYHNLDFVPCTDDLGDYIQKLEKNKFLNLGGTNLSNKLKQISENYDYCIIDCSQNADTMAVNTFIASDIVLIPCCCAESSYNGMREMLIWIEQIKQLKPELEYKIVINNRERNKEADEIIQKVKALVHDKMCLSYIRHQAKPISLSVRIGEPVVFAKRTRKEQERTTIVDDFNCLLKEINL